MNMKRIICAILVLCMLPACASALDLEEFNAMAYVLGASEIDVSALKTAGKYSGIVQDECSLYFEETAGKLSGIYIDGTGDKFLAYCCAAIRVFDPTGSTTANHGQLLTMYLMAHTHKDHHTGQTSNGYYFFIEPSETGFLFIIGDS